MSVHVGSRINGPGGICAVEAQDYADIVLEDDIDVQSTSDQAACLEQIFVVFFPRSLNVGIVRAW